MEVNELRIGNWVERPGQNNGATRPGWVIGEVRAFFRLTGIQTDGNRISLANRVRTLTTRLGAVRPIPLTEEIVLKLGFEIHDPLWPSFILRCYEPFWCDFYFSPELRDRPARISLNGQIVREGIVTLHYLQNLYFAITGQEMEVELW